MSRGIKQTRFQGVDIFSNTKKVLVLVLTMDQNLLLILIFPLVAQRMRSLATCLGIYLNIKIAIFSRQKKLL